jgi:SNF2 family DNA or RNA helicase
VENQASDRAHRIGQTKPVFIYKLVASNTVEEKIMVMQQHKKQLADQTVNQDEGTALQSLTAEDIMELFAAGDDTDAAAD